MRAELIASVLHAVCEGVDEYDCMHAFVFAHSFLVATMAQLA